MWVPNGPSSISGMDEAEDDAVEKGCEPCSSLTGDEGFKEEENDGDKEDDAESIDRGCS